MEFFPSRMVGTRAETMYHEAFCHCCEMFLQYGADPDCEFSAPPTLISVLDGSETQTSSSFPEIARFCSLKGVYSLLNALGHARRHMQMLDRSTYFNNTPTKRLPQLQKHAESRECRASDDEPLDTTQDVTKGGVHLSGSKKRGCNEDYTMDPPKRLRPWEF